MIGKNTTAQALTIRLLQLLDPMNRMTLYRRTRARLAGKVAAIEHLDLCVRMAGELQRDPHKWENDFIALAKTIVARQRHQSSDQVSKKDVYRAMHESNASDASANTILNRIHDHARDITSEEILNLCSKFEKESSRLFWENQVRLLFPQLRVPDVTDGPVLDCLQGVWDNLDKQTQERARWDYSSHSDWFDKLRNVASPTATTAENAASQPPTELYTTLEQAQQKAGVTLLRLQMELNLDPKTYRSYKKEWLAFEESGYEGDYPRHRLSRDHLLYLAVFLDMDFYTAAGMLAIAGYGFHFTKADAYVAEYLLKRAHPKDYVLNKLRHW